MHRENIVNVCIFVCTKPKKKERKTRIDLNRAQWTGWSLIRLRCQTVKDSLSELSEPLAKEKEDTCGIIVMEVIICCPQRPIESRQSLLWLETNITRRGIFIILVATECQ